MFAENNRCLDRGEGRDQLLRCQRSRGFAPQSADVVLDGVKGWFAVEAGEIKELSNRTDAPVVGHII